MYVRITFEFLRRTHTAGFQADSGASVTCRFRTGAQIQKIGQWVHKCILNVFSMMDYESCSIGLTIVFRMHLEWYVVNVFQMYSITFVSLKMYFECVSTTWYMCHTTSCIECTVNIILFLFINLSLSVVVASTGQETQIDKKTKRYYKSLAPLGGL